MRWVGREKVCARWGRKRKGLKGEAKLCRRENGRESCVRDEREREKRQEARL